MSRLAATLLLGSAHAIADAVRQREVSAVAMAQASIARIQATDGRINAFTTQTFERALAQAQLLDVRLAEGDAATANLPLLGVPLAVKNLFDIQGVTTLAGSKIEADKPPAVADALLLKRLCDGGAVLMGALNMDEYAYGFTTENSHRGATHNPHDLSRVAGGSSGEIGRASCRERVSLVV